MTSKTAEKVFWIVVALLVLGLFVWIVSEFHHLKTTPCALCGGPLISSSSVKLDGVEYHQGCINYEFVRRMKEWD